MVIIPWDLFAICIRMTNTNQFWVTKIKKYVKKTSIPCVSLTRIVVKVLDVCKLAAFQFVVLYGRFTHITISLQHPLRPISQQKVKSTSPPRFIESFMSGPPSNCCPFPFIGEA